MGRIVTLAVLTAFAVAACAPGHPAPSPSSPPPSSPPPSSQPAGFRVLLFSKTAGFRHASIPAGIEALRLLGAAHGFAVDATEDAGRFTAADLGRYHAVVFLSTTGDVLDAGEQAAFEAYIRHGGGYVGVHSAADTEYGWPFYGALVGAYFASHPAVQRGTVHIGGTVWTHTDEWYNFRTNPRSHVQVLATVDESSYRGGTMGADHPIAWCHEYQGGRAFYTALGHPAAAYAEPVFLAQLLAAVRYAAGRSPTCAPRPSPGAAAG